MKVDERVPEGGAIQDEPGLSAEEYGKLMYARLEAEYERFADGALASMRIPEGASVLEIGPGPGWAGIALLARRPDLRLTGLDASSDMVRAASANAVRKGLGGRAEYRLGTAEALEGVPDASVDVVVSRDSLHHWENPRAAFASISRVLRPTGTLYLSDERRDISIAAWAVVYLFGTLTMGGMSRYWRSSIRASYTPDELRALFPQADGRRWNVEGGFLDLVVTSRAAD